MKRVLLLTAGLLAAFAAAAPAADNFTFVIMADRTGGADQPMFERAVAEIALLKPDFVVTVGDLIQGYAGNEVRAPQWDSALAVMRRIPCPVYYAPGNHDIGDVESARLFFEKTDRPPYYSFDKGSSHFIVLNTALAESYGELDPHQKRWLERDLLSSQGRQHIFVFMHKTFWLTGAAADPAADPMHQLFKKYHVTAVFCGHGHSYVSQVIDGIRYAEIGATGADLRDGYNVGLGVFNQYAIGRIRDKRFDYAVAEVGHLYGPDLVSPADLKMADDVITKHIRIDAAIADGQKIKKLPVTLTIVNVTGKPIADTLRLTIPANWQLKQTAYPFSVKPGDTVTMPFELKSKGAFYPLPSVKCTYPFGNGKHVDYDRILKVTRVAKCAWAKSAITIDGKLDEAAWDKAATITQFCGFDGGAATTDPTEVKFLEDDSCLYFAAVCKDSFIDKVKATLTKHDDPVHQDDCIGCLIASGDGKAVYQFYVNPLGTLWDIKIDPATGKNDVSWNMECDVRTCRDKGAWIVEMKMAKSSLCVYPDTLKFVDHVGYSRGVRLNIRRKQVRNGENALWMPDWSYDTSGFGKLDIECGVITGLR